MNIIVLGNRRAGKSSILKKVFHKLSSNETVFLESTSKIEEYHVQNNAFTRCTFFDFPGNFEILQMNSLERKHLQNASLILYILDAKDEPYTKTIEKFLTLESEIIEFNPSCSFELFLHKIDGEMFENDSSKLSVLNEVNELIKLNSTERNLPTVDIHLTSITDCSIYISLSKILQRCHPLLPLLQGLLDVFILESMIDKIYIIDIISKLFISTDSAPLDLLSYEICCDAIDLSIELSTLYGTTSPEAFDQAFDSSSSSTISCENNFNLYLHHFDHLLFAVCILKDSTFNKKSVIDINLQILKASFEKMSKACDKIIHSGDEKKNIKL